MSPAWAGRLRLALRLGLKPDAFWRLSLAEWRALTEPAEAPALSRPEFEALASKYPDYSPSPLAGEGVAKGDG